MTENTDRRPATRSPGLIVTGVLALAVAGWAFADGPRLDFGLDLWPWILIVLGTVVGVGLVLSGFRNRGD